MTDSIMAGGGEEQWSAHRIWLRKKTNKNNVNNKTATDISKIKMQSQISVS